MFRGHVDLVGPTLVSGWAVDTDRPDETVEVSIFVDGRKLVQLACNSPREDLKGLAGLGNGMHGFRYNPYPPLSERMPQRVTVRHATSGALLGNGDVVLNAETATTPLDLGADVPEQFQSLPAPETPRETFELLSLYARSQGLYNLLRQVDFTDRSPRQVAYAALGAMAPSWRQARSAWTPGAARDLFNEQLLSETFQHNILRLFLDAFPEKRRLLFVHIPKCAGSDLSHHLVRRYASISEQLRAPHWTGRQQLFEELSNAVRKLHFFDTIFVHGHVALADYLEQGLARPCDRLFTILRDPVDMAISQVNYILTRLKADAATGTILPDVRAWLRLLEMDEAPADVSDGYLRDLGRRALRMRAIVIPNPMCHWLGGGDAAEVLELLAEHEVEVTNTERYALWRQQRWGIAANTRQNASTKFLMSETLAAEDLAYLHEISQQDAQLYRTVEQQLDAGASSLSDWAAVA